MSKLEFHIAHPSDLAETRNWPSYPDEFKELDYALRIHGWIDEYDKKYRTYFYIARQNLWSIGFSLLAISADTEAEFRIALHPDYIGKGYGKAITQYTLSQGFNILQLSRIYLIVRINNIRAISLYRSVGFKESGCSTRIINNKPVKLMTMGINAIDYQV